MALTSLLDADGLPSDEELAVDVPGELTERLGALARETELWLVPGSVFERVDGGVANTALVLSPAGELVASYRKCFPWQPYETSRPGTQTVCFDIEGIGRFGLAICHDGAFPEIFRSLAWQGAEAIFQLVLTETSDRDAETVVARAKRDRQPGRGREHQRGGAGRQRPQPRDRPGGRGALRGGGRRGGGDGACSISIRSSACASAAASASTSCGSRWTASGRVSTCRCTAATGRGRGRARAPRRAAARARDVPRVRSCRPRPRARSAPPPRSRRRPPRRAGRARAIGDRALVGGGERDEDLAAAVMGDRAGAREAEPGPARDPLELRRRERRIGRDDHDAAAGRLRRARRAARRAGARPAPRRPEAAPRAEVREHEHADGVRRRARRLDVPMPPFRPKQHHAGAGADRALLDVGRRAGDGPARRRPASTCTMRASLSQLSSHSPTTGITTSSTPTRGSAAIATDDGTVEDAADRHRRGQIDRRLEHPPLPAPAGSRSARPRRSAPPRRPGAGQRRRDDGRSRRVPRPARRADRHVADRHARNVGDRVPRPGLERARSTMPSLADGHVHERGSVTRDTAMPFVWSDDCLRHEPVARSGSGHARRGRRCRRASTRSARRSPTPARRRSRPIAHDDAALLAVHDERSSSSCATAWERVGARPTSRSDRVVPYVFARSRADGRPPLAAPGRRLGAAGLLRVRHDDADRPGNLGGGARGGRRRAHRRRPRRRRATARLRLLPAARPPRCTRSLFGGSCYLNNSAVAAAELVARAAARVAVLDIDAHHGNGTQEIFSGASDVLVASVHVDPGAGWFPHFLGFAGRETTTART